MKKFILLLFASVLGIVFCFASTEHVKIEKSQNIDFVIFMPVEAVSVESLNFRFSIQFNEVAVREKLIGCKKIKSGYSVNYGTYCKNTLLNCHLERDNICRL